MASKSLGTLTLDIIAKTGGFVAGMSKAERESAKWRKQVEKDMKAAGKVMGVALAAGATAAATALVMVVNKQRDLIDQQAKLAQRLRTTYDSLSNLARAGELAGVSLGQIETASKGLEQRLGQAIQGTVAQKDAFDRLKLSAQEIAELPLDERISRINKALRENVQASERAAVAGKIFGEEGAITMQMLDPGTIAEAARQVKVFGLNLSDVDAAKVEMANDALSTFGMLSEGIGKQLTVQLAPILKAIGDEFMRAAEEADGMGNAVQTNIDKAVTGLAFVMDAGDGVGRVFSVVGKGIALAALEINRQMLSVADTLYNGPIDAANVLLRTLSKIPGVDIEPVGLTGTGDRIRSELEAVEVAIAIALEDINDTLERPLAGQAFKQFVADAQLAGQAAAEATIEGRKLAAATGADGVAGESDKAADAIEKQISALERAAKTWGMTADQVALYGLEQDGATESQLKYAKGLQLVVEGMDRAKQAQDDYADLLKDLRTDEESLADQMRERLAIMDAMSGLSENQRNDTAGRIAGAATSDAPEFGGLAPEVGGPFGELLKIDEAEDELQSWYDTQLEMLETFRAERADLAATWDEEELALKQEHEAKLAEIEQARQMAQLASAESVFGSLADITRQFAGEQSGIYKVMFAAQKAAAIAQSMIAIQQGVAMAAANPWPMNLAAMASVAAATAGLVGNISSIGMAHDGIDSIPKTGSWILEKGERVTTAETSAKLDRTLSDIQQGRSGSAPTVNVIEDSSKAGRTQTQQMDGKTVIDVFVSNIRSDGNAAKAMQQAFGLRRAGR